MEKLTDWTAHQEEDCKEKNCVWIKVKIRILIPSKKIKDLALKNEHRTGKRLRLSTGNAGTTSRKCCRNPSSEGLYGGQQKSTENWSLRVTRGLTVTNVAVCA